MKQKGQILVNVEAAKTKYDIIVVGGGPAGIGSALSAAKMGAKTLLLECSHNFGGVANKAMFMPFNRLYVEGEVRKGVVKDFVEKVISLGSLASTPGKHNFIDGDGLDIHPEYFQLALFDLLEKYNCDYRLYSTAASVTKKGDRITGVVTTSKRGCVEYKAEVFIDASGDGDLAYYAGEEYMEGSEKDGTHMPTSVVFMIGNTDVEKAIKFRDKQREEFKQYVQRAKKDGYQTNVWYAYDRTTIPGVLNVNNGGPDGFDNIDATDVRQLTKATRLGIKAAVDFVEFARNYKIPGLEDCYLLRTGAAAVRDTRRFAGEYIVTLEDAETGQEFDDIVSRKYGNVDANQLYIGEMKSGYGYPYRAMLPKTIDGLLLAGRCGSSTFLGHAAGKSMGNMMEIGQAAGIAASMCVKEGCMPRQLDVTSLKVKINEWNDSINQIKD